MLGLLMDKKRFQFGRVVGVGGGGEGGSKTTQGAQRKSQVECKFESHWKKQFWINLYKYHNDVIVGISVESAWKQEYLNLSLIIFDKF